MFCLYRCLGRSYVDRWDLFHVHAFLIPLFPSPPCSTSLKTSTNNKDLDRWVSRKSGRLHWLRTRSVALKSGRFLTQYPTPPPHLPALGHLKCNRDISDCHNWGRCAIGIQWVAPTEAAKYTTMHWMNLKTKNYLTPNVSSVKNKRSWTRGTRLGSLYQKHPWAHKTSLPYLWVELLVAKSLTDFPALWQFLSWSLGKSADVGLPIFFAKCTLFLLQERLVFLHSDYDLSSGLAVPLCLITEMECSICIKPNI